MAMKPKTGGVLIEDFQLGLLAKLLAHYKKKWNAAQTAKYAAIDAYEAAESRHAELEKYVDGVWTKYKNGEKLDETANDYLHTLLDEASGIED